MKKVHEKLQKWVRNGLKTKFKGKTIDDLGVFSQASGKKGFEEAAKRLKMELEDRDKIMPNLRVQSRRIYLEKRKEDKVAELEADILDDEYLFDDQVYVFYWFVNSIELN